jgi:hypothetical protein
MDPGELTIHPRARPMPEWANEDERFTALVEDIRNRGIDQPILVDKENRIVDGRHRWRAAKRLQLKEVPTLLVEDESVPEVVINSLVQRRHFTKGALAYLVTPLLEFAFEAASKRRLENLKNPNVSRKYPQDTIGKTVEDYADAIGVGRKLLFQARELHKAFDKRPELREQFEAKVLNGEIGLGAAVAGIAGQEATKAKPKPEEDQLFLFEEAFDTLAKRFKYWNKFTADDKRETISPVIFKTVREMPADLRDELEKALKKVKAEEKKAVEV